MLLGVTMKLSRILTVGVLFVAALSAQAATVVLNLNSFLTGSGGISSPMSDDQLISKVTISDVAADKVQVKVENFWSNAVFGNGSFLSELFLETTLATAIPDGVYVSGNPIDGYSNGGTNASFSYDKKIEFPNPNNASRFRTGEETIFTIEGVSGLDATDFTDAMVHIQGLNNGYSAKFTGEAVPEPGTIIALGAGIAAAIRRRKKA